MAEPREEMIPSLTPIEPERIPIGSPKPGFPTSQEPAAEHRYAYETLLKCRELELKLHIERSNVCLVVEGALMAFIAPALLQLKPTATMSERFIPLVVAIFGLALSLISIVIVNGADFWISYWEHRLAELEGVTLPTIAIFRDHPSTRNATLLARLPTHLKYVSSRKAMLQLFRALALTWLMLLIVVAFR